MPRPGGSAGAPRGEHEGAMWMDWIGDEHEASVHVHQSFCRAMVVAGKVHMYIDGREVFDPSVEDMPSARRSLERAAFRRSGGRLPTALFSS